MPAAPGEPVRYRGRLFMFVGIDPKTKRAILRDDEGEQMKVRAQQVRPA